MRKTTLARGNFCVLFTWRLGVVQRVTRLSKLPRGNENSCEQLQALDRAPRQSRPRGSELPRGNELSRDHVNRPLEQLLPKAARYIPALSSRYLGKCAARVLKRSGLTQKK